MLTAKRIDFDDFVLTVGGGFILERPERGALGLVTVVTEANGGLLDFIYCKREFILAGLLGSCCFYNGICPVLVSPVQNIIFLTAHFFTVKVPIAQQPGQVVLLGRQSLGSLGFPLSQLYCTF
jgi:hypothetical protein